MMKKSIIAVSLSAAVMASADQGANGSTQDLLIQKLTQVQMGLAPSDPSRVSVLLRLADLHAEKARQLAMQEIGDGCTVCNAGDADRAKALKFYSEALVNAPAAAKPKVYLQMGHLYEMQGQSQQAEKHYKAMLEVSTSPLEKAEAYLSLAEAAFRKNSFTEAASYYDKVLATEGASSQGLATYRRAWCSFRLNEIDKSIVSLKQILQDPKLQSRMASSRGVADMQFLEEVSRDLATFMAARGIQNGDVESLYALTPESFKLQQVTILAREGLRLGQKEQSLKVWDFVYQKQSDASLRQEAQVRMAQLNFDLKNIEAAHKNFEMALGLHNSSCDSTVCGESAKALRQFVVGWNRLETAKASEALIKAYAEYLAVFPQDEEMYVWGAQAASTAENHVQAMQWNQKAADVALAGLANVEAAKKTEATEKIEKYLLLAIESAEKSKQAPLLQAAQDNYLAKSLTKEKAFDVAYQKAYAIYQAGDYQKAATELNALALQEKGDAKIRLQAAELSLDALALLKDDARIQEWAGVYGQKFQDKKMDFSRLQQKSILTQSAALATAEPDAALAKLLAFDQSGATDEDRKTYLKNKILLSEKTNKIREARVATEDLLREKSLTDAEREFALGRKVWFAELELDFATALAAAEQMKFAELTPVERMLKLAMYSELADKSPESYYGQYLSQSKDADKKALIALQLVRISKNPQQALEKYKAHFSGNMGLYGHAALDVYAQTKDFKVLEAAAKAKGQNKHDSFVMVDKILTLRDIKALGKDVAAHQLDTKNQNTIAKSLRTRIQMLEKIDKLANRSIEGGDWASQLLALDLVAKENMRFYNEALALPVPEGLTPEQENEYLTVLSSQVAPNQNTAMMAETKVKEFWSQGSALESYKKFAQNNYNWSQFILEEVQTLAALAPEEAQASWQGAIGEIQVAQGQVEKPTLAEMERVRTNLKQNPFAASAIQDAIAIEKKAQRKTMVEYLQGRLASLSEKSEQSKENP